MIANLTISILWLPLIVLVGASLGFVFRSAQIARSKKRVIYLENEMLRNHAEILKLQQELVTIEKNNNLPYKSRVVPMKDSQPETNSDNSDAVQKKKLNK